MSREERKRACPPSWYIPTSKETRVRVELLAKIIARVFPASGRSLYSPFLILSARSRRVVSSALEKSGMARKWRSGIRELCQGFRPFWQSKANPRRPNYQANRMPFCGVQLVDRLES